MTTQQHRRRRTSCTTKRRARARRSSSSTSSAATTAAGSRRCAISPALSLHHLRRARLSAVRRARDVEAYSQAPRRARTSSRCSTRAKIERAHIVGLSMGGFAALHFGLEHPGARAVARRGRRRLWLPRRSIEDYFRDVSLEVARQFEAQGSEKFAKIYALGAVAGAVPEQGSARLAGIRRSLGQHSDARRGQHDARRAGAPAVDLRSRGAAASTMTVPTLVMVGDEDDHCLQPGIFLKKTIPACGLSVVLPKTGHTLNLEEPEHFNRFVGRVHRAASKPGAGCRATRAPCRRRS